ncbi:hypothetical protein HHK36_019554 [Tetracentron sinense]|uniref:Uncharacterized protein n=1 Tax=Tetracentron sinense TaxID=13715 RepID=A0A834YTX7_TETSI|nr:hypothetical protein HHK36_019554 [Tetracentron sinense]
MADKRKSSVQDLSGAETEEKGEIDSLVVDKYNIEAAEILSNEALHLPISEAVPIYEQLLMTFPTATKEVFDDIHVRMKKFLDEMSSFDSLEEDDCSPKRRILKDRI